MSKKKSKSNANKSILSVFALALIFGIVSFIALLSISSIFIVNFDISHSMFWIPAVISSSLSAFICSLYVGIKAATKGFINGMFIVVIMLIAEFIIYLCFNSTDFTYKLYLIIPTMLICGFFGCVIGINKRKK